MRHAGLFKRARKADLVANLAYHKNRYGGQGNSAVSAVLNATGSQRVGPRHAAARLNESDLQQVADLVISSHRA
jgi:hypothetical protein